VTSLAAPEQPPPSIGLFTGRYRFLTVGLLLVVTLVAFEAMAVTTVMPVAVKDLNGFSLYAWGFSAFFTTSLLANVIAGVWADGHGPAVPIMAGLAIFAAGLLIAGTAPTMEVFVAGRAVQGLGGGGVIVALYVVIGREYDTAVQARMFGWLSGAWVLPSVLGPFVGGAIAQYIQWRWVFLGLIPLVVPGALMLAPVIRPRFLPRRSSRPVGKIVGVKAVKIVGVETGAPEPRVFPDNLHGSLPTGREDRRGEGAAGGAARSGLVRSLSAVAVAAGAVLVLYATDHLRPISLIPLVVGLVLLGGGLPRLVPAGTMRLRRGLPAAIALRGFMPAAFFGMESFLSLTLIKVHGFSPTTAGVALTVGSLGWSAGSWYQGRPSLPIPRNRLVMVALGLLAAGVAMATLAASPQMTGWVMVPAWIIAGTGMGIGMSSLSVLVLQLSPATEQGANTAAMQVCDGLGTSLSVGFCGALVTAFGVGHLPEGLAAGGVLMTVLAILGTIIAPRLSRP
jgi:MFS family permease